MKLYNFSKASYCVLGGRCLVIWSSTTPTQAQKTQKGQLQGTGSSTLYLCCSLSRARGCAHAMRRVCSTACAWQAKVAARHHGTLPTTALPHQSALTEPAGSMPVALAAGELLLL
eukprot:CAMPEP_0204113038 /NCGR_PEP_ID=MMETSP0361-20130328/3420_1 /ASSEMBLY_ACC=CAM_ASM_000343 /TAXON_ID=268821 /ORGANISM="Scrippsiella Hangoei, Strain SHTV-5" /LENGTH=114 /DNA_ID=CAMNT_0051063337 /DNA_START=86 /DNA_END=426 /DNA_ORIENTATION=+